ncbi:Ribonuclease I [Candidatus Terasakiella magnetica]|nr:Ribonuclease I [Candidatus Terasakiella magnetica]
MELPKIAGLAAALLLTTTAAMADQCRQPMGKAEEYDYLLLALSWSPAYCARQDGKGNSEQCDALARHGFIVHGLWPQNHDGSWPMCCRSVPPSLDVPAAQALSAAMPGKGLREHEWQKHGSCMAEQPESYFTAIRQATQRYGLAPTLLESGKERIKVSELKALWPVPAASVLPRCKGKVLMEVRLCLGRDLSPTPCPSAERDTCPGTVSLGPD